MPPWPSLGENEWTIFGENEWTSLGENAWPPMGENPWTIIARKMTRVPLYLPNHRRRWLRRTPAIAAGLTDHRWSVKELLSFRVPPPFWQPPKRRGRQPKAMKALIAQWCT